MTNLSIGRYIEEWNDFSRHECFGEWDWVTLFSITLTFNSGSVLHSGFQFSQLYRVYLRSSNSAPLHTVTFWGNCPNLQILNKFLHISARSYLREACFNLASRVEVWRWIFVGNAKCSEILHRFLLTSFCGECAESFVFTAFSVAVNYFFFTAWCDELFFSPHLAVKKTIHHLKERREKQIIHRDTPHSPQTDIRNTRWKIFFFQRISPHFLQKLTVSSINSRLNFCYLNKRFSWTFFSNQASSDSSLQTISISTYFFTVALLRAWPIII